MARLTRRLGPVLCNSQVKFVYSQFIGSGIMRYWLDWIGHVFVKICIVFKLGDRVIFISVSIDSAFFQWKELEPAAANGSGFTGATMVHTRIFKLGHHWFRQWLVFSSAPSHYLNQCGHTANWTRRNQFQLQFNLNTAIFVQENDFEHIICGMPSISFPPSTF